MPQACLRRRLSSGLWAPPIDPANLATSARPRRRNNARRCTLQSFNNDIRNRLPTAFKRCFDHSCHNMYPTADLGLVSECGNLNPTAQTAHSRRCPLYSRRYFVVTVWTKALFERRTDVVQLVGIGCGPPRSRKASIVSLCNSRYSAAYFACRPEITSSSPCSSNFSSA